MRLRYGGSRDQRLQVHAGAKQRENDAGVSGRDIIFAPPFDGRGKGRRIKLLLLSSRDCVGISETGTSVSRLGETFLNLIVVINIIMGLLRQGQDDTRTNQGWEGALIRLRDKEIKYTMNKREKIWMSKIVVSSLPFHLCHFAVAVLPFHHFCFAILL